MHRTAIFYSLILLFLSGCDPSSEVKRPLDTWVMRVNLDGRPNMIALALHKEMYAAYDARLGALYKVWKGDILFTGPVYDNLHGPQPSSRGTAYIEEGESSPWLVSSNGEISPIDAQYRSYQLEEGQITLKYTLALPTGDTIQIEEQPDHIFSDGAPGFERRFQLSGVPEETDVMLKTSFGHLLPGKSLQTDGEWIEHSFSEEQHEWGASKTGSGILRLNSSGATYLRSLFQPKASANIKLEKEKAAPAEEQETASSPSQAAETGDLAFLADAGKTVIGQNDCAACHRAETAVIGPSYSMIARKYEFTPEVVASLSQKIIQGGSGVWGESAMSAHPHVSETDAKAMAAYILSTVPDDETARRPGVAVDLYQIGEPLASLPEVVAGQNPNVSEVYPSVDFRSGNPDIGEATDDNFSGFTTDFVMEVNGYLNVPESGSYDLQFVANNGGKLIINGETVSEGHFYEGTFIEEIDIELKKGANKFKIEFYHHLFDKYLILAWRKDESEDYQPIPASAFTHDPFHIKPTSPGIKRIIRRTAPGFGASLEEVHPSFDLTTVRPKGFEPRAGDIEFRNDGRLVLCTWDGEVFEMENITSKNPNDIKVAKIADGLCEPLGITVVNDEVYVLQRWELTKLVDHDGDRITDEYIHIASLGSSAQFHEWSFGLLYRDGYFYCTTGIAMGRGADNMPMDRGKAIKIAMDGSYEYLAYGLKEPNGIGFGVDGEIFATDNEGEYVPVCKVVHIPAEGTPFFGNKSVEADTFPHDVKQKPPVIWLPQNEIGNSPSQPILMHHGPYEGQMIHGEITHGGIKRDFIEKVKGQYQGAVFRFTQGMEAGINRMEWGPDGALYAAGLGGSQDYGHRGHQFGLQRLIYNGKPAFEMLAIRAKSNGLEIEFTKPLRAGGGTAPADYKVQQWYYTWTYEGGSQEKRELENLEVLSVTLSEDRRKAFLELAGMKEEHVLYVQLQPPFLSADNEQLWSNEGWYTLNRIPDEAGTIRPSTYPKLANVLSPAEEQEGWALLFDGTSMKGWQADSPSGWAVDKGQLLGSGQSALLASNQRFENFELEFEWKVESGAEGGVLFHLPEEAQVEKALAAAPRLQLTDDDTEDARMIHTHKSGANYDIQQPKYLVTRPTNEYNHARLVVRGNQVEHWINGIKVLQYEWGSEEWKKKVQESAYASPTGYGQAGNGSIALYTKEGTIWFRNLRVRELPLM